MFSDKQFWLAVLERAVKTVAQTFAAASVVAWGDFVKIASAAGIAGVLSVFTSIASRNVGGLYGPSLATEGVADPVQD